MQQVTCNIHLPCEEDSPIADCVNQATAYMGAAKGERSMCVHVPTPAPCVCFTAVATCPSQVSCNCLGVSAFAHGKMASAEALELLTIARLCCLQRVRFSAPPNRGMDYWTCCLVSGDLSVGSSGQEGPKRPIMQLKGRGAKKVISEMSLSSHHLPKRMTARKQASSSSPVSLVGFKTCCSHKQASQTTLGMLIRE